MKRIKGKGQILNHSTIGLLVIENDSGKPTAHWLGPKMKSPSTMDADGFKRFDGKPILLHNSWWKVPDVFRADVFEIGSDFLMPVSILIPVGDNHFGNYKISKDRDWGEKLTYVTAIIRDKQKRTIGYALEDGQQVSAAKAIQLTRAGELDNTVVAARNGKLFLRTKKNMRIDDNLIA